MIGWRTYLAGGFGLVVIASGLIRYFERPDGEKGLWFGLVMGSLAIIAAILFFKNRIKPAQMLIWFCLLVVGGWFVYEALIKKGYANSETRMLIVIAITFVAAIELFIRGFYTSRGGQQDDS